MTARARSHTTCAGPRTARIQRRTVDSGRSSWAAIRRYPGPAGAGQQRRPDDRGGVGAARGEVAHFGSYPLETVRTMARIIEEVESDPTAAVPPLRRADRTQPGLLVQAAHDIADGLVADVESSDAMVRIVDQAVLALDGFVRGEGVVIVAGAPPHHRRDRSPPRASARRRRHDLMTTSRPRLSCGRAPISYCSSAAFIRRWFSASTACQ